MNIATMYLLQVGGVDFPTSVLLAAASSALGTTSASLKDALRLNPSSTATTAGTALLLFALDLYSYIYDPFWCAQM